MEKESYFTFTKFLHCIGAVSFILEQERKQQNWQETQFILNLSERIGKTGSG